MSETPSCAYCGVVLDGRLVPSRLMPGRSVSTRPVRDHVIPRARGGSDTAANVVWACDECNQAKGTDSAEEFIARGLIGRTQWRRSASCPTCLGLPGEPCQSSRGRVRYNLHADRQPVVA